MSWTLRDFRETYGEATERWLLPLQATVALIAMLFILFAPRAAEPVTLVPLSSEAEHELTAVISRPDVRLIARGRIEGSLIVSGHTPGFIAMLSKHGILALNASAPGCGPVSRASARA